MFCLRAFSAWHFVLCAQKTAKVVMPLALLGLGGCASSSVYSGRNTPIIGSLSNTSNALIQLQPPPRRLRVAVYDFPDLTGQRRPTAVGAVSELSTAVSQGSSSIVIEALRMTGGGTWFEVFDRTRDADQVRERTILAAAVAPKSTRNGSRPDGNIVPLPSAEYILNGGVMAFERSVVTDNTSAAFIGIGGSRSTTRNFVSVTLRLVRADTAEVVDSVTAYRSIDNKSEGVASHSRAASGLFPDSLLSRYPSPSDYIEADISETRAEMVQIATREAIEAALYDLIGKVSRAGLWNRAPQNMQTAALSPESLRPAPKRPSPKMPPLTNKAGPSQLPSSPTIPLPPSPLPQNQSTPLPPESRNPVKPQYSLLSPVEGRFY